MNQDTLLDRLASLALAPPAPMHMRVFASVVAVEGPEAIGTLFVASTDAGISYVRPAPDIEDFAEQFRGRFGRPVRTDRRVPDGLARALRTGEARDLDFDLRALSAFEQAVLRKALDIPRGQTRPYAWIAGEIGRPRAVRAAASVLARNPVPILIPCHRVVRSDGRFGDYLFGAEVKQRLLTDEAAAARRAP